MNLAPIFVPHFWRRLIAGIRFGAAIALCFVAHSAVPRATFGVYAAIALVALVADSRRPWVRPLMLSADMAAYSMVAWARADLGMSVPQLLLCAALLTTHVLVLHNWPQLVAAGTVLLASAFLWSPDALPALTALLVAAGGGLFGRVVLQHRLFQTAHQNVFYRAELQSARSLERERLAADFHDGPLQAFTGLQMRLSVVRRLIEKTRYADAIAEMDLVQKLWQEQVFEMRAFVQEVREGQGSPADLPEALRRLMERFERQTGWEIEFDCPDILPQLAGARAASLLQMVREALNNVHKHAGATAIHVKLSADDAGFRVSIEDNGGGFPFGGTYTLDDLNLLGVGPQSIRNRAKEMQGDLSLESRPGVGSTLHIRVPVD
jgi:signal transduction histidine kinase